jgi:hypothetical protein
MTYLPNAAEPNTGKPRPDLRTPARNRWFTNKLLDAYHMQLETDYFNHKRWLINRLIVGSGVVVGLDVVSGSHAGAAPTVVITPGLAIDWHGREIIVPRKSGPIEIPTKVLEEAEKNQLAPQKPDPAAAAATAPSAGQPPAKPVCFHIQVVLCYCQADGEPVAVEPGSDCQHRQCVPGTIFEKYEVRFLPYAASKSECRRDYPDLIKNDRIDHTAVVSWITRPRAIDLHRDPCVVLADIEVRRIKSAYEICKQDDININVRHVVYTNDLLFQLITQLCQGSGPQQHVK